MIQGMNHVGLSVPNLDRSIGFYRDVLGMELVVRTKFEGERIEKIVGLQGAQGQVALLRLGSLQLELFEFSNPTPQRSEPDRPVCHHGISHFCIQVKDIQGEYDRLKAAGVRFHCPPQFGRTAATYGRDPDGNVFELLEILNEGDGSSERDNP